MNVRNPSLWLGLAVSLAVAACGGAEGSDDNEVSAGQGGSGGSAGGKGGSGGFAGKNGKGGSAGTGGTVPDGGVCANGETRSCGTDEGACVAGTEKCANGVWGACLNAVQPAEETCDGKDHDCDGTPNNPPGGCKCTDGDTQPCYDGPAGTEGKGTCKAGTQTCVKGNWGSCAGAVQPESGKCAVSSCAGGPNPGCDCTVGDTRACYSGAAGTKGVGMCQEGTQSCEATTSGAAWGACKGEIVPEAEECDGKDHDCNGTSNDASGGCTCAAGSTQPCYTGPSATLGQGSCKEGTQACALLNGKYEWGACTGEVAPVSDDCDHASCTGPSDLNPGCSCINGKSESCYTGPQGTSGVGTCKAGSRTCAGGVWGDCGNQTLPATQDACVAPNAAYAAASDLDCSGALNRHNPETKPTAASPSGTKIAPPAGTADALQVLPLATVTFQHGATDVDGSTGMTWKWRLISAPTGNTAGLSGAPGAEPNDISTQATPTLFGQLVGDYVVGVVAVDATGCESAESKVLIRVRPNTDVLMQLTWSGAVDVDLHMVKGSGTLFGAADSCYWGNTNPEWGTVDPSLDIDDLAGCNPENIHFGEANGPQPSLDSSYGVYVHYYCDFRGHRTTVSGDPTVICYDPLAQTTTPVTATVKIYVDGQLAKIDGTSNDAVFTAPLEYWDTWKPANLYYDANGVWHVQGITGSYGAAQGCEIPTDETCWCGGIANSYDPYCGPGGAQCRELYP